MQPVSVGEARAAALALARVQPAVRMPLGSAAGHTLAADVIAPWPLPQWTAASMDGWAVRSDDLVHPGAALTIAGGGSAGDGEPPPLVRGSAWRVATGGRVPAGADSVIRQEDAETTSDGRRVTVKSLRDLRRNVRPMGGDIATGAVAIPAGTIITPGVIALLASLGESAPMVHRKPRVAILSSGDEVVSLDRHDEVAAGTRIADANGPMLAALVAEAGGVPMSLGLVSDDAEAIAAAVRSAVDADMVITAGGISVGERDFIPEAMHLIGAEVVFRRVRIRPGGPTTLAKLPDGRPWLALPGNPVSAYVTFRVFASTMIGAAGNWKLETKTGGAVLAESVARDPVLDMYLRVTLEPVAGGALPLARLTGNQGSWVTSSIALADALAVIEAGEGEMEAGAEVGIM